MRKFFKKIICVGAAAVMTASLFAVSACGGVYKGAALEGDISGAVSSNGGFAVEKGNYVYYINGKQTNTADNTFGKVATGAIMRISKADLAARNYANTQTVVPEIAHSGNTNGGLFVYGDYVYYTTPSSEKNSDGEILNSNILFKRAKLDGTEGMRDYFAQYTSNAIEYRYVLGDDGVVYLLYVATSESLYGTAYTNLHSVNTETGTDTLLAYNVDSVMFDSKDVTNPRVYYTMKVKDFVLDKSFGNYNQVYTVTADATEPNEYDFSGVKDYDAEEDPLYVNCGTLVLDGIGMVDGNLNVTQFNAKELETEKLYRSPYTYTLSNYEHGTLFYTRVSTNNKTAMLFAVDEDEVFLKAGHKPAVGNPESNLLVDGSNAANFTYIFTGDTLSGAFVASDNGLIKAGIEGGKLLTDVDNDNTFYLSTGGKPTILFTEKHGDNNYVYYSESNSGANGYVIKRLCYDGSYTDYNKLPVGDDVNKYTPVRVLDLDCSSDWYKPEMFDGQILFSSQTKNMTEYSSGTADYSHIMVCDVRKDGAVMTNPQLDELNEQYEKIAEKIDDVDETTYENLKNAYRYAHYTGDADYIDKLIKAYVEINDEDEEKFWSKETVAKFKDFVSAEGDWADFADTVKVNGVDVAANRLDYYYTLLGTMTETDAETYDKYLKDTYLQAWPETDESWFESLSTGAKVGFLIGVIGGSLLVIAAGTVVALVIIRKRKSKLPTYTKKRIKVDTTDDKSVDVYSTDDETNE